jgi:transcription antitermination factor NusA-like protein
MKSKFISADNSIKKSLEKNISELFNKNITDVEKSKELEKLIKKVFPVKKLNILTKKQLNSN